MNCFAINKELTTWISNFRDVVLYKCVYLSWSIVSYLKLWKKLQNQNDLRSLFDMIYNENDSLNV